MYVHVHAPCPFQPTLGRRSAAGGERGGGEGGGGEGEGCGERRDARPADVFSLGCLLHAALCGSHPYPGGPIEIELDIAESATN